MIKYSVLVTLWCIVTSLPLNYVADWPQNPNFNHAVDNLTAEEGPLRKKANEYDEWNAKYHHPYYGGMVDIKFADNLKTNIQAGSLEWA